jgi:hypothetical protein
MYERFYEKVLTQNGADVEAAAGIGAEAAS